MSIDDAAEQPRKGKHGGARPGSGRKSRAEKYEGPINKAERLAAQRLSQNIENLATLADGGYERVIERFEPAGTVLIDAPLLDADGQPKIDANGKPIMVRQHAFPKKEPHELVLVERRREIADKDRAANIWLTEFIAGKPTQQQEITGKNGGPLETVAMTPEQWIARENERMAQAEQTLALAPEVDEDTDA
jgi:hypothetical protein